MELSNKKKVLILSEWYLPGRNAGGPVKSIESFVCSMKEYLQFYILTTDTDLGETKPYDSVKTNEWLEQHDGVSICYLKSGGITTSKLIEAIKCTGCDYIYINSLYSKWFSIVPIRLNLQGKISCKIVLAPRGMLSDGALKLKTFKKKTFILFSRLIGFHRNITWHASNFQEADEIKHHFGPESRVEVIRNFSIPLTKVKSDLIKERGILKLFFLSRVSRVKNLHIAIKSLKLLKNLQAKVLFDVYGSQEDPIYLNECKELIAVLGNGIEVNFMGPVLNSDIARVISDYHFLFLPTSNENFGHSIFESLQCGVPVIISNKTPWKKLSEYGCGWEKEPVPENYIPILEKCIKMDEKEYAKMSDGAALYAKEYFQDNQMIVKTLSLFS